MANEYRVAIVGKTGTGKSSVGNSLLGNEIFNNSPCGSSMSQECKLGEADTSIGRLLVVDTPGLFDTVKPNWSTITELIKCIGILAPGPHVFIVVLSVGRFTPEDLNTVEILKIFLGDDTMHHIIVLFTRKDQLKRMSVEEFIADSPPCLTEFLEIVKNRYEFISNEQESLSHKLDVENVMSLIKKTVKQNGDSYYTEDMFKAVERVIKNEVRERQKKDNKSAEECRREIRTDIVNNKGSIVQKVIVAISSLVTAVSPILIAIAKEIIIAVKNK